MKPARTWSKGEDDLLRTAVARQEGEATVNWHEVASFIEGRNNKECRKRWVYSLEPSINKGAWEPSEDSRLRKGVAAHGTKWAEVSRVVGSRHPDQCSKRWHEVLKPDINRERWSLLEDNVLRNAVAAHGRKWIEIVERYFPQRTPIGTRNRYFQLQKKDAEGEDLNAESTGDSMVETPTESPSWSPHPSNVFPVDLSGSAEFMSSSYTAAPMAMATGGNLALDMDFAMSMSPHHHHHHQQAMISPVLTGVSMADVTMPGYFASYMHPPPVSVMGFDQGMAGFGYADLHTPH